MICRQQLLMVFVVLAAGCARDVSFEPDARPAVDGNDTLPDVAVEPADSMPDSTDSASDSTPDTTDASSDAAPPPKLSCGFATPMGTEPPEGLTDPTLRAGGLEIYVRAGTLRLVAKRKDLASPFGDWIEESPLPAVASDATFFFFDGQERAILSVSVQANPYRRELRYCETLPATSCKTITVVDSTSGLPISEDMDGPSVQVVAGTPVMVHNISNDNVASTADVYQATPTIAGNLLHWTTKQLMPLSLPNIGEDDPTISADGKIVAATRQPTGGSNDLWVAYRHSLTAPLSTAEPVPVVNTTNTEASAEIFQLGEGEIELFFASQRQGDAERRLYRSLCTY